MSTVLMKRIACTTGWASTTNNFADLTVWDMLFGTFRNPREFRGEFGFDAGGDRKMGAMLAFADVNAPLYGPGSGAKPKGAT